MKSTPDVCCSRSTLKIRLVLWAIFLVAIPSAFAREDHATLYFFNTSGWKAIPEKLTVLDNGEKIAALNREEYVVLSIAPGHHVLQPKGEDPPKGQSKHQVELDATPGATYYLSGGFTPKTHGFIWTFEEISKAEADALSAKMKLQSKK